jgi:hypothetical protein
MSKKKIKITPKQIPPQAEDIAAASSPEPVVVLPFEMKLSEKNLLLLTFGLFLLYFLISFSSSGFYQQDEAAHYLNMLRFWHNPETILNNWAKPGFKLVYALPALGGEFAVRLLNILFASFSAYFAYKVADKLGMRVPALAFLLLATQPFWVMLSFRNYSEIISAFLLIFTVYLHLNNKKLLAALAASYIVFIRQEFYPFLGLYFLFLVYEKNFIPALLTGVFPIIHNLWGAAVTGKPFYLLTEILKTSQEIGDAYPRKGFEHYFLMSATIFGSVVVALSLAYLVMKFLKKEKPNWFLVIPSFLYFLMYCIFNIQSFPVGPATAGNLRYLIIASPLFAVLSAQTFEELPSCEQKGKIFWFFVVFLLITAIFMTFDHNLVVFTAERDFKPLFGILILIALIYIPIPDKGRFWALTATTFFLLLISFKPVKLSEEDQTMKEAAFWYKNFEKQSEKKQLLLENQMFYYFSDKVSESFRPTPLGINEENLSKAPKGSIILWDSHYSYRPELRKNSLKMDYFVQSPDKYKLLREMRARDNTFLLLIFEKIQ